MNPNSSSNDIDPFADNPWAAAASSDKPFTQSTLNLNASTNNNTTTNPPPETNLNTNDYNNIILNNYIPPSSTKRIIIRLWNVLDILVSLTFLIWGLISSVESSSTTTTTTTLWMTMTMTTTTTTTTPNPHDNTTYTSTDNTTTDSSSSSSSSDDAVQVVITFLFIVGIALMIRVILCEVSMRMISSNHSIYDDDDDEDGCCCFYTLSSIVCCCCNNLNCNRFGLKISSLFSPLLALLYAGMGIWMVAESNTLQQNNSSLPFLEWLVKCFLESTPKKLFFTFLIILISCFECVRWQLLLIYRNQLLQYDHIQYLLPTGVSIEQLQQQGNRGTSTARRGDKTFRPWWWQRSDAGEDNRNNHHDALTDPLLSNNNQRQRQSKKKSWFRRLFSSSNNNNDDTSYYSNPRDDASVEFESVQGSWAIRSEEDPYWWSRDDDDNNNSLAL